MKFLLVDDNEINLEVQKLMLEGCGLDVRTAGSGEEAVRLALSNDFFMIFMDIHMPGMDGYEAAELIRRSNADVRIIALSADEIPETEEAFIRSGMNGSLTKPLQLTMVKELLGKYITVDNNSSEAVSGEEIFSYDELRAVMKDEKSIYRLIKQFLTVHGKDCERISSCMESRNFPGAREILHNIIGISGNMFCKRLYTVSSQLISEARRDCSDSLPAFVDVWEHTFAELSACRKRLSVKYELEQETIDWSALREEFFALCSDFDVAAADVFSENTQAFMENMDAAVYKKLRDSVLSYDFMYICENMEVFNV